MVNKSASARLPSDRKMIYLSPALLRDAINIEDWTNREFVRRYLAAHALLATKYPRARILDEAAVATFRKAAPLSKAARASTQTAGLIAEVFGKPENFFIEATSNKSVENKSSGPIVEQPAPKNIDGSEKIGVIRRGFLADQPFIDLPLVSVLARASFVESGGTLDSYSFHDTRRIYLRGSTHDKYSRRIVFEVEGDSMEPYINSGDEVVCLELPEGKWEAAQNGVFVIGYGDDNLTIKKVIGNDLMNKGTLTLRPWRDDLAPFTVRRSDIRSIYRAEEALPRPFKVHL